MHIINLGYLENKFSHLTKSPDSSAEESNRMLVELDIVAIISDNKNQHSPITIDAKAEQKNKRLEKAERHCQRKINLI